MLPDHEQLILIARSFGFSHVGVVDLSGEAYDRLAPAMAQYRQWCAAGYAGEMEYLSRHAELREDPARLMPQPPKALRAIVVGMNYLHEAAQQWQQEHAAAIRTPERAVISVYARGRDYHKVIRQRLLQMARALGRRWSNQDAQFRACVDSAPVLEVELARQCGLGWRGKHTLLLNREQGSMFFLGVLLTDLPIAPMQAVTDPPQATTGHCGTCTACLQACPTQAFVGPYQLDARRCISYLTIELKGSIPIEMRPRIGNRIYGCDDCQQVCPWNQYAQQATLPDFDVRHGLNRATLLELLQWTEAQFLERHQGSAILRIGYERWLRNLVVAAGNAVASADCPAEIRSGLIASLQRHRPVASDLVAEHIDWALAQGLQDRYPERDRHHGSQG